jgi:hypothetical protein
VHLTCLFEFLEFNDNRQTQAEIELLNHELDLTEEWGTHQHEIDGISAGSHLPAERERQGCSIVRQGGC